MSHLWMRHDTPYLAGVLMFNEDVDWLSSGRQPTDFQIQIFPNTISLFPNAIVVLFFLCFTFEGQTTDWLYLQERIWKYDSVGQLVRVCTGLGLRGFCIYVYVCIYIYRVACVRQGCSVRQIPLKMLHSRTPPHPETQIRRYKFKFNRNLNLNLYHEIQRNLSFLIGWDSGM